MGIFPQHTKDVQSPQAQGSEAYNRHTQATVEKLTLNKRSIRIALHLKWVFLMPRNIPRNGEQGAC